MRQKKTRQRSPVKAEASSLLQSCIYSCFSFCNSISPNDLILYSIALSLKPTVFRKKKNIYKKQQKCNSKVKKEYRYSRRHLAALFSKPYSLSLSLSFFASLSSSHAPQNLLLLIPQLTTLHTPTTKKRTKIMAKQ